MESVWKLRAPPSSLALGLPSVCLSRGCVLRNKMVNVSKCFSGSVSCTSKLSNLTELWELSIYSQSVSRVSNRGDNLGLMITSEPSSVESVLTPGSVRLELKCRTPSLGPLRTTELLGVENTTLGVRNAVCKEEAIFPPSVYVFSMRVLNEPKWLIFFNKVELYTENIHLRLHRTCPLHDF